MKMPAIAPTIAIAVVFAARAALAQGGPDICGGLDLADGALADCRRQWDEAQNDAQRRAALNTFQGRATPHYAAPTGHPRAPARFLAGARHENGCEQWELPPARLAKCRTEMKAARTDEARTKILARYHAIATDRRRNASD